MAKAQKLDPSIIAIGSLTGVWGANYSAGHYWGYPFVYCWTAPHLMPLYISWGGMILYICAATLIFQLLRGSAVKALMSAAILTLIVELPRIASQMFSVGGSCG